MCSALWDPPSTSASNFIEDILHFALKIVSKLWSQDYSSLLYELSLATLSHRWKNKIITIFKMKSNLSHVINSPLSPLPLPARFSKHYSPYNFTPIFSRTASFHHYFFLPLSNYGTPSLIQSNLPHLFPISWTQLVLLDYSLALCAISFFLSWKCYQASKLACLVSMSSAFFSLSLHIFCVCAGMYL